MSDYKSLCILGRQPEFGIAELESLYGPESIKPLSGAVLLNLPAEEIDFRRLGGSLKVAKILATIDSPRFSVALDYIKKSIPAHLKNLPEGKLTLGLSVYGLRAGPEDINRAILEIKKVVKNSGRPCRVVPNKTPALNSAQVLHNKLTHRGGWELLLVAADDKIILAQTQFVQDIEAYAARDQARPSRDSRVGMLPPKLAQILINLAGLPPGARLLDPFCGTGVVLQEALLMGYSVVGADIEPRMVEYSTKNIQWLFDKFPALEGQVDIELGDATQYIWPRFSGVVSEIFLGRPLNFLPPPDQLKQIINDTNTITRKFLLNLANQLKSDQKVVLAVPAWRNNNRLIHLPVLDHLTDMGYAYLDLKHVTRDRLVYFRENQVVARQIIRITKV